MTKTLYEHRIKTLLHCCLAAQYCREAVENLEPSGPEMKNILSLEKRWTPSLASFYSWGTSMREPCKMNWWATGFRLHALDA